MFTWTGWKSLHSGGRSDWLIDCSVLADDDLATLARVYALNHSFTKVVGVPNGGCRFAGALTRHANTWSDRLLIADDVFTTGASMDEMRGKMGYPDGMTSGVVIFARGPTPGWIDALFTKNPALLSYKEGT